MNYKIYIYAISLFISVFAISGINFNNFFKKSKEIEAKVFTTLLIMALSYLTSSFVINFIEAL